MEKDNSLKFAADIMTKKPFVMHSSMTVTEAAAQFLENAYSSSPVLSSTNEILGVLDEFSLIKIKLIQHLDDEGKDKLAMHTAHFQPPHFIKESTPLVDVVKEMIKAPGHRLLVVNNASQLVGIISPKDVLRYVAGERKKAATDLKSQIENMKSDLEKTSKALEQAQSTLDIYKDMVMDNPTMIHSVDANGKILMVNKKMLQVLGYENQELMGQSVLDLYAKPVHHEVIAGLKKIMETGFHQNTFSTMIKKNGEKIRVDVASTALHDDSGKFIGTITASRAVDSDLLLRALHGVLSKGQSPNEVYGNIQDLVDGEVKSKAK